MTLEQGTLLCEVAILVATGVFGLWLRHIHGLLKDANRSQIESLQAALASKDALIEKLKAESAPTVIRNYKEVVAFAEETSKKVETYEAELAVLQQRLRKRELQEPQAVLTAESHAFIEASKYFKATLQLLKENDGVSLSEEVTEKLYEEILTAYGNITEEIRRRVIELLPDRVHEDLKPNNLLRLSSLLMNTRKPLAGKD